jgi:class 3 adenylate cyclase
MVPSSVVLRRRIIAYLSSTDPRLVKHAVQTLCSLLDRWPTLSLSDEVRVAISLHAGSQDLYVRRWLSKLFALLGDQDYLPWVRNDLLGAEPDLENRTWAVSALAALQPHIDLIRLLRSLDLPPVESPYALSVRYLRTEPSPIDPRIAARSAEAEDAISPMWLALLHSRARGLVSDDLVAALTVHHDPNVAEYATWALVQHPAAGLADSRIDPHLIPSMPAQNRRWALRLLGKDPLTVHNYGDLVIQTIDKDPDPVVREGLAIAIGPWKLAPPLEQRIAEWYTSEADELTSNALQDHLERFAPITPVYRDALEVRPLSDNASHWLQRYPSSSFPVLVRRPRVRVRMAVPPSIREFHREETYIVAMDTVGFSRLPDSDQVSIVQQLLAACAQDRHAAALPDDQVVYLITGDGLIVGFRGADSALVPLRLALRLSSHFARLHDYQVRFGIHAGPAEWLVMNDGARQLIGHAVNWTVRTMSHADGGQVLVSQAYHDGQAHPARDYLPGITFSALDPAATKHGEPLVTLEASVAP